MTALFREHYFETIELLSDEQREQIRNNTKDYIVIDVQATNTMAWIDLSLTNDFPEEKFSSGECSVFDNEDFEDLIDNYEYKTGKKFYSETAEV